MVYVIDLKKYNTAKVKSGKVEIDIAKQIVKVSGKVIDLNKEEYDIILMLVQHKLL